MTTDEPNSTTSPHADQRHATRDAPRIELTVKSLTGLESSMCKDSFSATAAFSGSAVNMQVGSSRLCPETGLLLVESELCSDDTCALRWPEGQPPHITIFDVIEDNHRTTSLQKANRDSYIVRQDVDMSESHRGSYQRTREDDHSLSKVSIPKTHSTCSTSAASLWSADGMPEVVDLSKSLEGSFRRSSDDHSLSKASILKTRSTFSTSTTPLWSEDMPEIVEISICVGAYKGIAYLVYFGRVEDRGFCTMDIPVRKQNRSDEHASIFTEESRLQVEVNVVVPGGSDYDLERQIPSRSSGSSDSKFEPISFTRSMIEGHIGPLLNMLRYNEKAALRQHLSKKGTQLDLEIKAKSSDEASAPTILCSLFTWDQIRENVAACSGQMSGNDLQSGRNCDESTIATRPSWGL